MSLVGFEPTTTQWLPFARFAGDFTLAKYAQWTISNKIVEMGEHIEVQA